MFGWISQLEEDETATPVSDFPGYFITDKGRLYSTISNKWIKCRLMAKTDRRRNPYTYEVKLTKNKKLHATHIHTLVGRHFCEGYKPGLLVLHRDETLPFPQINFKENLYLGTQKDNNKDKFSKGRHIIHTDSLGRFTKAPK